MGGEAGEESLGGGQAVTRGRHRGEALQPGTAAGGSAEEGSS